MLIKTIRAEHLMGHISVAAVLYSLIAFTLKLLPLIYVLIFCSTDEESMWLNWLCIHSSDVLTRGHRGLAASFYPEVPPQPIHVCLLDSHNPGSCLHIGPNILIVHLCVCVCVQTDEFVPVKKCHNRTTSQLWMHMH